METALKSALALLQELKDERKEAAPRMAADSLSVVERAYPDEVLHPPVDLPPEEYHQAASDVLGLLIQSDIPMNHTAIVSALAEIGHTKRQARAAIAVCQIQCWIEHDLVDGYVLSEGSGE